jgi:hypothetical protein
MSFARAIPAWRLLSALSAALAIAGPAGARATQPSAPAATGESRPDLAVLARRAHDNPANGDAWLRLGTAALHQQDYEVARSALQEAHDLGFGFPARVSLQIAEAEAHLGHKKAALDAIERALNERLPQRDALQADDAFATLHDDPRFRKFALMPEPHDRSRNERWRYDVDVFVEEAQRLDANEVRPAFGAAFLTQAKRLEAAIPTLSDDRIGLELQRLAALLGDGHSHVNWPGQLVALPVQFYTFSDGTYVVAADREHESLIGTRLVEIGSRPIASVLRDVAAFVSCDNAMSRMWQAPQFARILDVLEAVGAASNGRTDVVLQRASGAVERVRLSALPGDRAAQIDFLVRTGRLPPPHGGPGEVPLYLVRRDRNFWIERLPRLDAVYVRSFQFLNSRDETVAAFAARLRDEMRTAGAHRLIVDVRQNNGGNGLLRGPLVRAIADYDALPGHRTYVVTDRASFSATQIFINDLEQQTGAVFVGEPSGSRPRFVGEDAAFQLPFSKLRANVSYLEWGATGTIEHREWIPVTLPAPLAYGAYAENRDPSLEAIAADIANPAAP